MGGAYGTFLEHFRELFRPVVFWEVVPKVGPGYDEVPGSRKTYKVVVLDNRGTQLQGYGALPSLKNSWRALDIVNGDFVYALASVPLKEGMFLNHPDDGQVYRIVGQMQHTQTGGFSRWEITRVTGDSGTQDEKLSVIEGRIRI